MSVVSAMEDTQSSLFEHWGVYCVHLVTGSLLVYAWKVLIWQCLSVLAGHWTSCSCILFHPPHSTPSPTPPTHTTHLHMDAVT